MMAAMKNVLSPISQANIIRNEATYDGPNPLPSMEIPEDQPASPFSFCWCISAMAAAAGLSSGSVLSAIDQSATTNATVAQNLFLSMGMAASPRAVLLFWY